MKVSVHIPVLIFIWLLIPFLAATQVNTEKFRKYSDKQGFLFNTKFRLGYSSGNSEYISVDGNARLDYNAKKNNYFIVTNYEFKETNEGKVSNKGFVHLRGIHPFNDVLAAEAFLQQEFNEFILLEDRKLAGAGLRTRILHSVSKEDTMTRFSAKLGTGMMYEREVYDIGKGEKNEVITDPFRVTSYLTLDWMLSDRVNCWAVGYFQPNIEKIHDFRSIFETGIEVWIIGKVYLNVELSYRYNNEPVGDVKHYDVVINNGVRVTIP